MNKVTSTIKDQSIGVLILVLSFICSRLFAQTPTPGERQQIIANLDSINYELRSSSVSSILLYKIVEAIPALERNIWDQETHMRYRFLQALSSLEAPNVHSLALAYLDSLDNLRVREIGVIDPLIFKVRTTEILFRLGDFSTAYYVFDYLRKHEDRLNLAQLPAISLLETVIRKVPALKDSARNRLMKYIVVSEDNEVRRSALNQLASLYGQQIFNVIVERATNDPDPITRLVGLNYLFNLQYPYLRDFLAVRLGEEPEWSYRVELADSLLRRFGTPQNYQVVRNHLLLEQNPTAKSSMMFALRDFIPPHPPLSIPVIVMIDTLISYKHQVAAFGWLKDKKEDVGKDKDDSIVKKLDKYLFEARKELVKHDSVEAREEMEEFVKKVEELRKESIKAEQQQKLEKILLTEEGYKFLYYDAKYIIERLSAKKSGRDD